MGLPATVIGRPLEPFGLPYVDADNRGGARQAVEYLVREGRRRIAHIAGPSGMTVDAVVGFDDMPPALKVRPTLTTVRQPIEKCGAGAVRQLAGGIRIDGPAALILPTALITRQSA